MGRFQRKYKHHLGQKHHKIAQTIVNRLWSINVVIWCSDTRSINNIINPNQVSDSVYYNLTGGIYSPEEVERGHAIRTDLKMLRSYSFRACKSSPESRCQYRRSRNSADLDIANLLVRQTCDNQQLTHSHKICTLVLG